MNLKIKELLTFINDFKWFVAIFFVFILLIINYFFAKYFIPNEFTLATGNISGNYHKFGLMYKDELEKSGIKVNLLNTQGSIENFELLKNKKIDMAFVQNGIIKNTENYPYLKGVASLYNEPIFLFYKSEFNVPYLSALKNKKISIGQKGSGTYALAKSILKMNGIEENEFVPSHETYLDAKNNLLKGNIDAAFFTTGTNNELIKELGKNKNFKMFSFDNYDTYRYHFPNLGLINIPQGFYDLENNLPEKEVKILSSLATLVSQEKLHPLLVENLLITISKITKDPENYQSFYFEKEKFPSALHLDFKLHNAAEVFFRDGQSFLSKYLPYYLIFFVSRTKYILLPLIPFLIIVFRIAPGIYGLRVFLILKKKYRDLSLLEEDIIKNDSPKELEIIFQKLRELKNEMDEVSKKIPAQFQKDVYDWKIHHSFLMDSLEDKINKV